MADHLATWVKGGLCLLPDGAGHLAERRDIEIRGGWIEGLHRPEQAPAPEPQDRVVEAASFLVVPGLVNAHTHSPDNLIRGSAPNLPLELWSLHSAAGREARSEREIYVSALLGCIELLRTGTTTVLDHIRLSPHPDPAGLEAAARAYEEAGLRALIAPVVADRPVVATLPFEPEDLGPGGTGGYGQAALMPAQEQIDLLEAFVDRWHRPAGRIRVGVGPSGPQRCSDILLERAADLSWRRDLVFHTHVLETRAQRAMGFKLYGCGMIRAMAERGLLSPRANLVHAIWLEPGDLEIIANAGAAVVHNPVSNAKLGSGRCALPEMLGRRLRVALGTDSACCNDSNNLLETAKWAALVHNGPGLDPENWVGPERALTLATCGGAEALGLAEITGAIRPGLAADLTLVKLNSPGMVPLIDPVRQLVQSETAAAVDTVLVAGQVVLRGGACTLVNEADLWGEAGELAAERLRRNRGVYADAAKLAGPIKRMYRRLDAASSAAPS